MEKHVRVTMEGPVLATLILAGWLEMLGAPPFRDANAELEMGGSMDLHSETAEYWVELPCDLIYDLTAAPGVRRGTLGRFGPPRAGTNGAHVATYLLRLVVGGLEKET